MKFSEKSEFLHKSAVMLEELYDMILQLPNLSFNELNPGETVLVIIDMINGFAREGELRSSRIEALIPAIADLSLECDRLSIARLAFADNHTEASPEFGSYPKHCMSGTYESEIVDELKVIDGYLLIPKNSTNGFLEQSFQQWLDKNRHIKNFIIAGDCTDICIQQFAVTLKTWFNMKDEPSRIIVPLNVVDTYDLGLHNADLLNAVALFNMQINGVELVSHIV